MGLSARQMAVLRDIATPDRNEGPFPPLGTVRALIKRGLVEAFDDPDDLFACLVGAQSLRLTKAGHAALEDK